MNLYKLTMSKQINLFLDSLSENQYSYINNFLLFFQVAINLSIAREISTHFSLSEFMEINDLIVYHIWL